MADDIDALLERRRLRRRGRFWRTAAIVVAIVLVVVLVSRFGAVDPLRGDRIARLTVEGTIEGDRALLRSIENLAENDRVKAVILHVDSPGGTTSGSEALFEALRDLAEKKPLVTTMGSVAASGGYIAAIAGDHIVARRNTITGSIGVLFQSPDFSGLMETVGVDVDRIKSAPLKGEPSGFSPLPEEARKVLKTVLDDSFDWFKELVRERRRLTEQEIDALATGRIFTGGQAVEVGLVDEIGGENRAIDWLARERGVDRDLSVVDYDLGSILQGQPGWFDDTVRTVVRAVLREAGLSVDGLVSVWHPSQFDRVPGG